MDQIAYFDTTFNNIRCNELINQNEIILYRGVTSNHYDDLRNIVCDKGIISSTWDSSIALEFTCYEGLKKVLVVYFV
jgi:hypothetical protein